MSTPDDRTAPGSSYFVTTRCWRGRNAILLHEFVVMPNHLHLLLTSGQTTTLKKAVQRIQGGSPYQIGKQRGHKMEMWKLGFHDWATCDSNDRRSKGEYVRMNSVGAQLAEKAEDRAFSSVTGKFTLDPVPEKYLGLASVASGAAQTLGRKPRSPKGFHS